MSGTAVGGAQRPRRGGARRSTLSDVARVAGVSVGTVSNFLNRPDKVAPATQTAIEEAIALLDFVPNGQARSLARGRSRTVGMIVTDLSNSFFVDIARGAEEAAADAGHSLLVASSVNAERKQQELLRVFDEARFAGVLIAPFEAATDYREPEGLRGPAVLLNVARPVHYGSSVVSDDELGGYLAARHMIELGRRWLHFVGGPVRLAPIKQRLDGVRRAVEESDGVALTVEHVAFEDHLAEGAAIGRRLRDLGPLVRPDAVVSTSDLVALSIIHTVQGALRVPEDLAVIGYDNNAAARDAAIPVSTVAQAGMEMGAVAFDLLLEELTGELPERRTVSLKPHLVVRASSFAG
ncbi:UNVERIFIED_CONTAM: LacI family transcriptional regulator [Microbacterium sp. SLM126]